MWGRRKTKNRRNRHQPVLGVKRRSDHARRRRFRIASVILGLAVGGVVLFFGVWHGGRWLLDAAFYKNPSFALRHVEVRTDGVIHEALLRRWAGVEPGENLFRVDLERIKRDLEMAPSVRTASVYRRLPDLLRLTVSERLVVAQTMAYRRRQDGRYDRVQFHLDGEGHVIPPMDRRLLARPAWHAGQWLPMLVGLNTAELVPGRALQTDQGRAALKLIQQFARSPMAGRATLHQVDISDPAVLRVRTGEGSEVVFGLSDLDRQLRRWRLIYDYGLKHGLGVTTVDLSIRNNLPVRWRAAARPRG